MIWRRKEVLIYRESLQMLGQIISGARVNGAPIFVSEHVKGQGAYANLAVWFH